jgi:hypothetical protein
VASAISTGLSALKRGWAPHYSRGSEVLMDCMLDCQSRGSEFDPRGDRHTKELSMEGILILVILVLLIIFLAKRL